VFAPVDPTRIQPGFHTRLQVLGVALPGVLIFAELWVVVNGRSVRADGILQTATAQLHDVDSRALVPAALVVLIGAYVVGLLLRQVTVRLLDRTAGLSAVRRDWDALVARYIDFGDPIPHEALQRLVEVAQASGSASRPPDASHSPSGTKPVDHLGAILGSLGSEAAGRILVYTKLWLRTHEPLLAVEHLETEITALRGLLAPLLLGIPVSISLQATDTAGLATGLISSALLVAGTFMLYHHIEDLRAREPFESAQRYLLAHAYEREELSSPRRRPPPGKFPVRPRRLS
jgi:hypothetical protein